MTDTHTHLYMPDSFPDADGSLAVERGMEAGVSRFLFPAVDLPSFPPLLKLADAFPENIGIAVGIHPTELTPQWEKDLQCMLELLDRRRPVAIGEVGIDLHWDATTEQLQRQAFYSQLELAAKLDLPVIIHSRDALIPTLEVLESFLQNHGELPRLIFHSFTGSATDVASIRKVCDPWFGINGVVTFKNARDLAEAIPAIGINRILLETDSPYLSPVPWRGKRNESAHLSAIKDKVASLLQITPQEVEDITDRNAFLLFPKLKPKEK